MSKLAHSNQECMDEIERRSVIDGDYMDSKDNGPPEIDFPPFIAALKTGGTKEEAIFALERMWEESQGWRESYFRALSKVGELRSALEELTSEVAPTMKSENRLTQRLGNALLRARRVLASLDGQSHSGGA